LPAPPLVAARPDRTADPGRRPPRVPEHPREGRLPSRCAETRQARPGQAARIKEPPPCAPPRRGKNDEEGTDAQGTTRTPRLNDKLRACPDTQVGCSWCDWLCRARRRVMIPVNCTILRRSVLELVGFGVCLNRAFQQVFVAN